MTLYIGNDEISKKIILENISGGGIDLPEISEITKGKILGNDGSTLSWVDESDYIASEFNQTLDISSVTNCITKIPQDIKLELTDGTLTLKAGSKVYDGAGNVINITSDITRSDFSVFGSENYLVFYSQSYGGLLAGKVGECTSGATDSSSVKNHIWYDTTSKQIKFADNSGTAYNFTDLSLPLCRCSITYGTGMTSIDQVFNGFGYIGNTIFALPGIEGLIPNGFNEDGSLKNIKFTTTSVLTNTNNVKYSGDIVLRADLLEASLGTNYNQDTNYNILSTGAIYYRCLCGKFEKGENGRIISFKPKTTFQAVDYNEYYNTVKEVEDKASLTKDEEIAGIKTFKDEITAPNQVDYTQITNCITKIPQDINLELVDGTLTLKAGSKVYIPNGVGVFDEFTIQNDFIHSYSTVHTAGLLLLNTTGNKINGIEVYPYSIIFSGTEQPSGNIYIWYNTTSNIIKTYLNGVASGGTISLPMAEFISNGSQFTSIKVFNGFGYIGSTIFALPGVEGLTPNGRNTDGSLNNIKFTVTDVKTYTNSVERNNAAISIGPGDTLTTIIARNTLNYDALTNYNYNGTKNAQELKAGILSADSTGRITSFSPNNTFQAIDRSDTEWASTASKPSSRYIDLAIGAANSKYKAPANGTFVVGKRATAAGQFINITVLDADDNVICPFWSDSSAGGVGVICGHRIQVKKGQQIRIDYNVTGEGVVFRFIYDEGAK